MKRITFLFLLAAALSGCATQRPQTLEERRAAKERWERYAIEEEDPY